MDLGQALGKRQPVDKEIHQELLRLGSDQAVDGCLGIGVYQQDLQPFVSPAASQRDCGRGLRHTATLVGNCQTNHDALLWPPRSCSRANSISVGLHQRRVVPGVGAGGESSPSRILRKRVILEISSWIAATSSGTALEGRGARLRLAGGGRSHYAII